MRVGQADPGARLPAQLHAAHDGQARSGDVGRATVAQKTVEGFADRAYHPGLHQGRRHMGTAGHTFAGLGKHRLGIQVDVPA